MHPENHYHLSEEGVMPCYIAYYSNTAAAVCSVFNNKDIASLEFVCTLEEYRGKGLAKAVCVTAIKEAFACGSKIITVRAFPNAKKMYKRLGFQLY